MSRELRANPMIAYVGGIVRSRGPETLGPILPEDGGNLIFSQYANHATLNLHILCRHDDGRHR